MFYRKGIFKQTAEMEAVLARYVMVVNSVALSDYKTIKSKVVPIMENLISATKFTDIDREYLSYMSARRATLFKDNPLEARQDELFHEIVFLDNKLGTKDLKESMSVSMASLLDRDQYLHVTKEKIVKAFQLEAFSDLPEGVFASILEYRNSGYENLRVHITLEDYLQGIYATKREELNILTRMTSQKKMECEAPTQQDKERVYHMVKANMGTYTIWYEMLSDVANSLTTSGEMIYLTEVILKMIKLEKVGVDISHWEKFMEREDPTIYQKLA